ncbi:glutaminase A [Oscillatoria sp. CS-180]|uniref:glutaminase A n=1 Tax=Oscillatoria sp. CS-180 TaxID=3021720 RepID=UPI00232BF53D|nr:glutaminase A [Oscillatoria sp. CS-180]MDB9529662.1 glutaminase A [Oscillatoria sp. CS-180]
MDFERLTPFLKQLHRQYQPLNQGAVASYLPELAKADPNWFGISVVSADGQQSHVGHTSQPFTIQSISKPFVYGLALEDWGEAEVLERIGVEPTGDPFNSLIEPEEISRQQYNPLVNVGAIITTSLIGGESLEERSHRLRQMFATYMGRAVSVNAAAFHSKRTSDHLNRALAHMLLNFEWIEGDIAETLELYFQQCSLQVTCQDLAVMAATLANDGKNPVTGKQAIAPHYVKHILSVMYTCGLYEFSGQWAYKVGIPAKSGLAGAIIGVVPHQMGIAVFSPPLGEHKKSWRGVNVFEELSQQFHLHLFKPSVSEPLPNAQQEEQKPVLSWPIPADRAAALDEPEEALWLDCLQRLYHKYLPWREGEIYTSEPDLTEISHDSFGISIATTSGQVCSVGDWHVPFLIQSISKVFAYGLALEDWGRDEVLEKVDVEPTGDAYDSIIKVESKSKRPYNPMVNAGAIATTSLIKGQGPAHRLNRILDMYHRYIGHRVFVDTPTFVSERMNGDHNWAISYLLRSFGMISGDISQILDLYLQQCSVLLDCRDLAVMGATLANNGVNPLTGETAIEADYVRDLLSIMYTCGMYDFAGGWVYRVGFPAKSGVGGGIIGVVPNRMGIAVFSPPLDRRGNSIRGIKVCEELSRQFELHILGKRAGQS